MIIRKKLPRSHKLHEPIRHDGSHPRPVTRRDFMATGFLSGSAVLIGSSALVAAFTDPRSARAATLAQDVQDLQTACGIATNGAGKIPFICFDLAGGANLTGSEILIGGAGGQLDFLSTAGYGQLGLPGDMLPNSPNIRDRSCTSQTWLNPTHFLVLPGLRICILCPHATAETTSNSPLVIYPAWSKGRR